MLRANSHCLLSSLELQCVVNPKQSLDNFSNFSVAFTSLFKTGSHPLISQNIITCSTCSLGIFRAHVLTTRTSANNPIFHPPSGSEHHPTHRALLCSHTAPLPLKELLCSSFKNSFLRGPLSTQNFSLLLNDLFWLHVQWFSERIWSEFLCKHLELTHNSVHCKYSRTWQEVS